MDFESLALFHQLSQTLHFGRTSQAAGLSASALSRRIQQLEEALGTPLFERDNRRVALTAAGERLVPYAADALARWDAVRRDLETPGELSGSLSLFCTVTASHGVLPQLLASFRRRYPGVQLRLQTGDAVDALGQVERGAVDVAVAALPDSVPASLETQIVTSTALEFVAPATPCETRERLAQRPVPWDRIPMVLSSLGLIRRTVRRWFREQGFRMRDYGDVSGNEACLALVSLGCGVGVVPRLVIEKSPLLSSVDVLRVRPALPALRVGLCTKRASLKSPVVAAFWDSLAGDA